MDSGLSITAEKLIEITARLASKINVKDEEIERLVGLSSKNIAKNASQKVAFWLVEQKESLLYCKLCGKGPFTKKGLYLHLTRLHKEEIKGMLMEELKNEIKALI
ncbi:hypothetical protein [Stygiolobus caldivivus]|uniref:Uncharacterized protein n=1 Tax=Stygiolobus caldivivus TaxID=2824673 RepID=A0A8D5U4Z3_9CREN|nr:hypothetical protein [Stygiolobus caldivivus]BCU69006.1 hypothetical protein KN1_03030 [Stygiolobus caldivivus]